MSAPARNGSHQRTRPPARWPHRKVPKPQLVELLARGLAYPAVARALGVHRAQILRATRDLGPAEWERIHERAIEAARKLADQVVRVEPLDLAAEMARSLARLKRLGAALDRHVDALERGKGFGRSKSAVVAASGTQARELARTVTTLLAIQERVDRLGGEAMAKRALVRALDRVSLELKQAFFEELRKEALVIETLAPAPAPALTEALP